MTISGILFQFGFGITAFISIYKKKDNYIHNNIAVKKSDRQTDIDKYIYVHRVTAHIISLKINSKSEQKYGVNTLLNKGYLISTNIHFMTSLKSIGQFLSYNK